MTILESWPKQLMNLLRRKDMNSWQGHSMTHNIHHEESL